MRNILFVHNGPLYRDDNNQIYGTHFTDTVKERYLLLGDHVTFLMREVPIEGASCRFSPISSDRFSFTPVPDILSPKNRLLNHRSAMMVIERAVQEADVIVARIPSLISRLAVGVARKLRKPYLLECVACNWDALWNHHWKAKISAPWYFLMQRSVVSRSPHVIYVTEQFLQHRYPTRGHQASISNVQLQPTGDDILDRRLLKIRSRAEVGVPLKIATVANVGVPYKGQGDVIIALRTLDAAGIEMEYHLVGEGDSTQLKALARSAGVEQRVIFHGAQRHERVFELLDEMDMYVQPSRQEGLPRAVIEAMSRSLPVVGARTGGIPELLDPVRVFKPGDTGDFIRVVKDCISPKSQEADARRNFTRAKDFREDVLNARRAAFYAEFLKDNGLTRGEHSQEAPGH